MDLVSSVFNQESSSGVDKVKDLLDSLGFGDSFHDFIGPIEGFSEDTEGAGDVIGNLLIFISEVHQGELGTPKLGLNTLQIQYLWLVLHGQVIGQLVERDQVLDL